MPTKRGGKKTKRKTYKGKKNRNKGKKSNYRITKQPRGFSQRVFVPLKMWQAAVTTGITLASPFSGYFASSAYSPKTNYLQQAQYFDQYATIYTYYRVHAMKVTITVTNYTGTAPLYLWMYPSDTSSAIANPVNAAVWPGAKTIMIPMDKSRASISMYHKVPSILGISKLDYRADQSTKSAVNTSPLRMGYIQYYFSALSSTAQDMVATYKFTYYTEFMEPKILGDV